MTWRIEFLPSARAELLALDRQVQARILRSLHRLAAAPRSAANVKMLKGNARYRLRVGDWRVIYTLLDDVLVVLVVRGLLTGARPIADQALRRERRGDEGR